MIPPVRAAPTISIRDDDEGPWGWTERWVRVSETALSAVSMIINFLERGNKVAPVLALPTNCCTRTCITAG